MKQKLRYFHVANKHYNYWLILVSIIAIVDAFDMVKTIWPYIF